MDHRATVRGYPIGRGSPVAISEQSIWMGRKTAQWHWTLRNGERWKVPIAGFAECEPWTTGPWSADNRSVEGARWLSPTRVSDWVEKPPNGTEPSEQTGEKKVPLVEFAEFELWTTGPWSTDIRSVEGARWLSPTRKSVWVVKNHPVALNRPNRREKRKCH